MPSNHSHHRNCAIEDQPAEDAHPLERRTRLDVAVLTLREATAVRDFLIDQLGVQRMGEGGDLGRAQRVLIKQVDWINSRNSGSAT